MSKPRSEIAQQDCWNVETLYLSSDLWHKELKQAQGQEGDVHWPEIALYKGRLADPKSVYGLFEFLFRLDRQLSKLFTYAHLKMDEDLGHDGNKHDFGLITKLLHDFQLESSWIEPEFLALSDSDYEGLMADLSLKPFQFYLEKIMRKKAHTLCPEEERLLALSSKALDTSYKAFGALNNVDLTFKPAVDSEGKEFPLSNGSYLMYVRSFDRELRKSAFQNLHQTFEGHANTLCELIQGLVEGHYFMAKARKFDSCLESALFSHKIDPEVYMQLIQTVRKGLPALHEYIALRKNVLGLDEIHAYDLYVPLIEENQTHTSFQEACNDVVASVAPLGREYQDVLRKGLLNERWVDIYENTGKRSGAYSSGCYDSMPYILMNYHGTLNDVLTLAHEAGHSMHSYLSHAHQPYVYSQYPIFVAEVASTFNEQLLLRHLLSKAKTAQEKATLINYQIEGIRGTIFRQALFAEFELQLHQWIEEGVPLTPTLLKQKYLKLNEEYYGPNFALDSEVAIEWARIPHFYYDFYVYQYATGLSAALALFNETMHSDEARLKYLQFLGSGGSRYPLELLEIAGVDMKSSKPIESALAYFQKLLAELKKVCNSPNARRGSCAERGSKVGR
jgi:oligoendopeptidase F